MNRNELVGKKEIVKGDIKEAVGKLTGNANLKAEGASERAGGVVQERIGKAGRKVGEAIEDLGRRIKR
jgi:uncharacterized protein YjbJ (UPF0337 family)